MNTERKKRSQSKQMRLKDKRHQARWIWSEYVGQTYELHNKYSWMFSHLYSEPSRADDTQYISFRSLFIMSKVARQHHQQQQPQQSCRGGVNEMRNSLAHKTQQNFNRMNNTTLIDVTLTPYFLLPFENILIDRESCHFGPISCFTPNQKQRVEKNLTLTPRQQINSRTNRFNWFLFLNV